MRTFVCCDDFGRRDSIWRLLEKQLKRKEQSFLPGQVSKAQKVETKVTRRCYTREAEYEEADTRGFIQNRKRICTKECIVDVKYASKYRRPNEGDTKLLLLGNRRMKKRLWVTELQNGVKQEGILYCFGYIRGMCIGTVQDDPSTDRWNTHVLRGLIIHKVAPPSSVFRRSVITRILTLCKHQQIPRNPIRKLKHLPHLCLSCLLSISRYCKITQLIFSMCFGSAPVTTSGAPSNWERALTKGGKKRTLSWPKSLFDARRILKALIIARSANPYSHGFMCILRSMSVAISSVAARQISKGCWLVVISI